MTTLQAFNDSEVVRAKQILATTVAKMMGRKFEEGDWASVYSSAKNIPAQPWSNLHIDVMHEGLGVEHKTLCVGSEKSLLSLAGTTLMHPSATRSIRIESTDLSAEDAMISVLNQYRDLIAERTKRVASTSASSVADMRTGWLIWERSLTEFLYFEEEMYAPDPRMYWAEWHERAAKGSRKSSKNLWIYEYGTNKKRYSVTTSAGAKIQPYFDIPAPSDPNLYLFRVQSEPVAGNMVRLWITSVTADRLRIMLDDPSLNTLSSRIIDASRFTLTNIEQTTNSHDYAIPIDISIAAHESLITRWGGVSDEHRVQLLIHSLSS